MACFDKIKYNVGDIFAFKTPSETTAFSYLRHYSYDTILRVKKTVRMNFQSPFVFLSLMEIFRDSSINDAPIDRFCFLYDGKKIYVDKNVVDNFIHAGNLIRVEMYD